MVLDLQSYTSILKRLKLRIHHAESAFLYLLRYETEQKGWFNVTNSATNEIVPITTEGKWSMYNLTRQDAAQKKVMVIRFFQWNVLDIMVIIRVTINTATVYERMINVSDGMFALRVCQDSESNNNDISFPNLDEAQWITISNFLESIPNATIQEKEKEKENKINQLKPCQVRTLSSPFPHTTHHNLATTTSTTTSTTLPVISRPLSTPNLSSLTRSKSVFQTRIYPPPSPAKSSRHTAKAVLQNHRHIKNNEINNGTNESSKSTSNNCFDTVFEMGEPEQERPPEYDFYKKSIES
jgi:hypothetical protein